MRQAVAGKVILITGLALILGACADEPIGQPCTFSWPVTEGGDLNCADFPSCAPLQNTNLPLQALPANDNCPVDCIQLPSLECTNLICVATQVEEPSGDHPKEQLMNGQCTAEVTRTECLESGFGCMGYCTKECLSDASCPKGYRCAPLAPFGENLRCDDEALWGDGGGDDTKRCTDTCTVTGGDPDPLDATTVACPSSVEDDPNFVYNYELCDQKDYSKCCTCLCYRFCPLRTKKFCRRVAWDATLFPFGLIKIEEKVCTEE